MHHHRTTHQPNCFCPFQHATWALLLTVLSLCFTVVAHAKPPRTIAFLSDANPGNPLDIALQYIRRDARQAGRYSTTDLHDLVVKNQTTSTHNGATHIYLRQRWKGLEVCRADIDIHISQDGRVICMRNRSIRHVAAKKRMSTPLLSAQQAAHRAAAHLGLQITEPLFVLQASGDPDATCTMSQGGISQSDIPAKLMYFSTPQGDLALVWDLVIQPRAQPHWWHLNVHATTGEVVWKNDWVWESRYQVYALPTEHPDVDNRMTVVDPPDKKASPFGWHDTNGTVGAEFTDTRGNNVLAQEDTDSNDTGGFRPDGGSNLVFNFSIDLNRPPVNHQSASIANLFYWNNVLHDLHYQYGFDEASGNFQENNYGRGGIDSDPVHADAQDGSSLNNANFSAPPDGLAPRMELFLWSSGNHNLEIHQPSNIVGNYAANGAQFGPGFEPIGMTGLVAQALDAPDGPGFSSTDGCSPLTNGPTAISGNIALIDRGDCFFVEKVKNAQDAGAIAAIIVNNAGDSVLNMAGQDSTITIPSLFIGQSDGDILKAELTNGVQVTMTGSPNVDGSIDSSLIIHEYGHGVSTRLTGGAENADCLNGLQSGGLGEGWSDWWAIVLTAQSNDSAIVERTIAAYASGNPNLGIRTFPYCTDTNVNPLTYGFVQTRSAVHGVGEIWAVTLWDMYWNLVSAYGFDPDFYDGTGGNNLALQLVLDGLKLQPCNPTFLDARDALLLADQLNFGGMNQAILWKAFAKRGMGWHADDGGSHMSQAVIEDFSVPDPSLGGSFLSLDVQIPGSVEFTITNLAVGLEHALEYSTSMTHRTWIDTGIRFSTPPNSVTTNISLGPLAQPATHLRIHSSLIP